MKTARSTFKSAGPFTPALVAAVCLLMFSACRPSFAIAANFMHDLQVELIPQSHSISASDKITIKNYTEPQLVFFTARQTRINAVTVDGAGGRYIYKPGELMVFLDPSPEQTSRVVTIAYEAVFNDPVPSDPVAFDNPGFGVEGTVSEKGVLLLSGSGWYPLSPGENAFNIKVIAPKGTYAVMAGEPGGHEDMGEKSTSVWKIDRLGEDLALSAAKYVIRSDKAGKVPVFTYFLPESDALSETYLKASTSHISFYENLHGPYAFPKFAVVENFFPTGYGFPSYTLLGTSVLRLPFIPQTSLRHEIAHCWWGNGVLVDYDAGNWSEGLTTYVSDYLSRETVSEQEAAQYRRQMLRDYTALAVQKGDLPLSRFLGRTDPATRAVGYGKSAFVFHMIRKRLGEDAFWNSLRRIYRERFQVSTSWEDFRKVFSAEGAWSGRDSKRFFDQWISRSGAPVLRLSRVRTRRSGSGWTTTGTIHQKAPYFDLNAELEVTGSSGEKIRQNVRIGGASSFFTVRGREKPERVVLDPDTNLFRLLYPEEIPATANSLKSSTGLIAVLCGSQTGESARVFKLLLASLNHPESGILHEDEVDLEKIRGKDILFFGLPRSDKLRALLPEGLPGLKISEEAFSLEGVFSSQDSDSLFAVVNDPHRGGKVTALFVPVKGTGIDSMETAARKITHYGQYSYLTFSRGTNRTKGTWEVSNSPVVFHLK